MQCCESVKKKRGELLTGVQREGKQEKVYFFFEKRKEIYVENKKRDLFIFSRYPEIYFFCFRKEKVYIQIDTEKIYTRMLNAFFCGTVWSMDIFLFLKAPEIESTALLIAH
ncbi:MAG: hypothetical protein D3913_10130 [Candidatus Electrothrix sp. LOE1_4_5]|nr:hypothetical protein [Candidatus Electrothrix gigas]